MLALDVIHKHHSWVEQLVASLLWEFAHCFLISLKLVLAAILNKALLFYIPIKALESDVGVKPASSERQRNNLLIFLFG